MPGRLTLSQRLTRPDGLPTAAARTGVVALMALAATAGYAGSPEPPAAAAPRVVDAIGLAGDLPIAAPEAEPALKRVHAIPALRRGTAGRPARRAAAPVTATVTPEPVATATPEPVATAEPTAAPVVAPPAAPVAPVPAPAPRPRSTPAPTFDSSG